MPPDNQKIAVSYGGGVDSVAVLVCLYRLGIRPTVITMANPGSEWPATMRYLEEWTQPLLAHMGWPPVTLIARADEARLRPPAMRGERRYETLEEECLRTNSLPSVAYGWKKCSQKFKGEAQRWWFARQQWALDEWAAGRKITKVIGYDFDEFRRVENGATFKNDWEAKRFTTWFPLYEARLTRAKSMALIASMDLPIPPKSACTFCPNNKLSEWVKLRAEEPALFASAVAMSRAAKIDSPAVVGLMRCNPHGERQLHEWADRGDSLGPPLDEDEDEDDIAPPCECAT